MNAVKLLPPRPDLRVCKRVHPSGRPCRASRPKDGTYCEPCARGWPEGDDRRPQHESLALARKSNGSLFEELEFVRKQLSETQDELRQVRNTAEQLAVYREDVFAGIDRLLAILPGESFSIETRAREVVDRLAGLEADLRSTTREREALVLEVQGLGGQPVDPAIVCRAALSRASLAELAAEMQRRLDTMAAQAAAAKER